MYANKDVSLVQFHEVALESARNSGYLYIACIVTRYAEFEKGFDYLEKHWTSFHDLSGDEILILVAGDDIRKKLKSDTLGVIVDNEEANLLNKNVVTSGELEVIGRKKGHFESQLKEGVVEGILSKSIHTNQTRDLMKYFSIDESQLPALCLTSTLTGSTSIYKLDDTIGDEFYKSLKYIQTRLKKHLSNLSQLSDDVSSIQEILAPRDRLNSSFTNWRNREFGANDDLDEFINTYLRLELGEQPKILQDDAREILRSYANKPKLYKSGRKKLDKYYSLVEHENELLGEVYSRDNLSLEQKLRTKIIAIHEYEKDVAVDLAKHLEIENIKEVTSAFDGKINIGFTKVDIRILVNRLGKLVSRIQARFK